MQDISQISSLRVWRSPSTCNTVVKYSSFHLIPCHLNTRSQGRKGQQEDKAYLIFFFEPLEQQTKVIQADCRTSILS
jgi:hypothetical protein